MAVTHLTNVLWRDTDVGIYDANKVAQRNSTGEPPISQRSPVAVLPLADEGSLEFEATSSFLDLAPLRYVAVTPGVGGDDITIEYVDPAGNNESLDVTVTEDAIEVSLATDGSGNLISTAQEVADAVNDDEDADDLVRVFVKGAGSLILGEVEATNLGGGLAELPTGSFAAFALDPNGRARYITFDYGDPE